MNTINTNAQTLTAALNLDRTQDLLNQSLNRLSSGSQVTNPADNPAGVASAGRLSAQGQRLGAASTNVQNALAYTQTADSFLDSMGSILTRMGQLATLAQDPTKNPSDLAQYTAEFQSLQDQLRSTIGGTTAEIGGSADITSPAGAFNGMTLFGSTASGGVTFDVGGSAGEQMTVPDINLRGGSMLAMIQQDAGGDYTLNLTDSGASAAIGGALQQVGANRAALGAAQSRLGLAASSLQVAQQNLTSAVSGISDVDVASESTRLAKYNILMQSGSAMLVQANQAPQSVLKLLHSA